MRKFIVILAAIFMAATTVQAGSIGGRSGGFSSSRSVSAPSYSASSSSFSRSGGISGGRSVGMSRPDVVAKVAPKPSVPAPAAASPSYSYRPASAAPSASQPAVAHAPAAVPSGSPGLGSTFLAGAGGGLVGSMIGNAISGNHGGGTTVVNNGGGGGAPNGGQGAIQDPAAGIAAGAVASSALPAQAHASGGGFSFWSAVWETLGAIFWVALLAGGIFCAYRLFKLYRQESTEKRQQEEDLKLQSEPLPFAPVARFHEVQDAYFSGDHESLRPLLGPNMLADALKAAPAERTATQFSSISYETADRTDSVISIHYRGEDLLDGQKINELWHFVNSGGKWLLDGIDQV